MLDSLAELTNKVDTLSTRVAKCDETCKEIKRSLTECLQTCQESLEVITQNRKEVKELKIEINEQKLENAKLKSNVTTLEDKMTILEFQSLRDTLLIDDITEEKDEHCTEVVTKMLKDDMKLDNVDDIKVVRCHRLGYKRPCQKSRPIIGMVTDKDCGRPEKI